MTRTPATQIVPTGAPSDRPFNTLGEIKTAMTNSGSHFWTPAAMRFFNSRASENVYPTPYGTFFVTSERFDYNEPRMYTVRFIAATEVQTPREWEGEIHLDRFPVCSVPPMLTYERLELVDTSADAFQRYASARGAHGAARSMQRQLLWHPAYPPIAF